MFKKTTLLMISVICTLGLLFIIDPHDNQVSAAQQFTNTHKYPRSTYPRSMRGTWYSYDKYDGLVTTHIYKHRMTYSFARKHKGVPARITSPLRKYVKHNVINPSKQELKQKQNWSYIDFSFNTKLNGITRHWINVYGWFESAGDGSNYNVSTLNGRKVLSVGGGAGNWLSWSGAHNYRNARTAKRLAHKHYQGFLYQGKNGLAYGTSKKMHS